MSSTATTRCGAAIVTCISSACLAGWHPSVSYTSWFCVVTVWALCIPDGMSAVVLFSLPVHCIAQDVNFLLQWQDSTCSSERLLPASSPASLATRPSMRAVLCMSVIWVCTCFAGFGVPPSAVPSGLDQRFHHTQDARDGARHHGKSWHRRLCPPPPHSSTRPSAPSRPLGLRLTLLVLVGGTRFP